MRSISLRFFLNSNATVVSLDISSPDNPGIVRKKQQAGRKSGHKGDFLRRAGELWKTFGKCMLCLRIILENQDCSKAAKNLGPHFKPQRRLTPAQLRASRNF